MNILFLSFYYEPDICAGSFRNTPLAERISSQLGTEDLLHVVTTQPNRYHTYIKEAPIHERKGALLIERIKIPLHKSGFKDQVNAFKTYFLKALNVTRRRNYDLVYASSSRLFTAFLASIIARRGKIPLYLDIRDIFTDTMNEVFDDKILKAVSMPVLNQIEKFTFNRASHINLVSEGFREYFNKYKKPSYSFFSNGIDDEFLHPNPTLNKNGNVKIITYAGNIGEGQGLHRIVPEAAKKIGNSYKFRVIGDGGARKELEMRINQLDIHNVELLNPVSRNQLKKYYEESDYLFLHLNDYDAFKKVLPSKIFEYGAYDKPIIAGVSGFARVFMEKNISNIILFEPCNVDQLINKLKGFKPDFYYRDDFIRNFRRDHIMKMMAHSIIDLIND